MEKEYRKTPRVPFNTIVKITSKEDNWEASSIDISIGGMYLISEEKPPIGKEVEMEFRTRDIYLKIPAIVRWINTNGFGVQFGLLGAKETHAITKIDSPYDLI